MELLAPAGNYERFLSAINFGADAIYLAGKQFGLRAMSDNFSDTELAAAVLYAHNLNKKVYITLNIFARSNQFPLIKKYIKFLEKIKVDAVIVSDIGVLNLVKETTNLEIHISTQASVLNKYTAMEYVKMGAKRIILARELEISEIADICKYLKGKADVECFVHGAMCISYSGRCLLSNYLTHRDSNQGACVQACRWEYSITEKSREGEKLEINEDKNGTYILNSKDLNLIEHLKELKKAGVTSLKIEGRMKSAYYVATVVNAYRRAINDLENGKKFDVSLYKELEKTSHRQFTTGFTFNDPCKECLESSTPVQSFEFMATVLDVSKTAGQFLIEQRNRFKVGDELEILSPSSNFNKTFIVENMFDLTGTAIFDAKNVQEKLYINCPFNLIVGDMLRKKV